MTEAAQDFRGQIVAEARSWLGVPFAHQGRTKVGVDCLGLIAGIAIACGLVRSDSWSTDWATRAGYARTPANGVLADACHSYMRPIPRDDAQAADVVLIRYMREPQHLAILVPYLHGGLSLIHALGPVAPAKVVEHRFDAKWRGRVVEAFALPGVA